MTGENQAELLRQRNIGGAELAVGLHDDLLLVAGGLQRDVGTKTGRLGDHLEGAVGATALNAAADIAAGFAPVAGNLAACCDHRGQQVEFVGVAGAGEAHVHAGAVDFVGRAAADALARSVIQRHGAAAVPVAGQAGERTRLGMACGCRKGRQKKRAGCVRLALLTGRFPSTAARDTS
jgi:hypothetical protein